MLEGLRTICDAVVATGVCYGPQRQMAFKALESGFDTKSVEIAKGID